MRMLNGTEVSTLLDYPSLIQALHQGFAADFTAPPRLLYSLSEGQHDAFALLPAWNARYLCVKAFTYLPQNAAKGRPVLHSQLMLFARESGEPLAFIDGVAVTCARTAAVSALAAFHLAKPDAASLLLLGTGNLAMPLLRAHLAIRPLRHVTLWGRNAAKVKALWQQAIAELLPLYPGLHIQIADDVVSAQQTHQIIISATGSAEPLLFGELIAAGTHVDLLGNHNVDKRECDSALVQQARVFVDDKNNVLREAGELLLPIAEGCFSESEIQGDLAALCRGGALPALARQTSPQLPPARQKDSDITLFKSVGTALSDLLCAALVYERKLAKEPYKA